MISSCNGEQGALEPMLQVFPSRIWWDGNCLGHTKLKVYYWSISLYRALPEGWDEQAQEMKPKMGKWEDDQVVHQDKGARLQSGVWRKGGSRGERWGRQNNSGWSWEPSSCSGKCITCLWMKPTGRNRCDGRKMELFTSLLINIILDSLVVIKDFHGWDAAPSTKKTFLLTQSSYLGSPWADFVVKAPEKARDCSPGQCLDEQKQRVHL